MRMKQLLSLLMALALIVSSAAIAAAESTDITNEDTGLSDGEIQAATPVYTLDEMLGMAMSDAYARQAAYAAYAQAYPDSRSISNLSVDTQIVLLEMLLKAHGLALPENTADVTVPETQAEAYLAIAQAESNAVRTLRTYLSQEALTEDAQLIFRMVMNDSSANVSAFVSKARAAMRAQEWTELLNGDNAKKYVIEGTGPMGGTYTVYVITNSTTSEQTDETAADTVENTTETTDATAEGGTGN